MTPRRPAIAAALLLAACLSWPPGVARACSGPEAGEAWRLETPLGTFELSPEVRQRLEALERSLNEAARDLRDLLKEKTTLTPEQEKRLHEIMERLREQLRRPEQPGQPGLEHALHTPGEARRT